MKLTINWAELGRQLWAAVKPVLLGAIGISTGRRPQLLLALASRGLVALTGCSALTPSSKTQGIEVCAIGIPGIAIITSTSQSATYDGGDTNTVIQANPADITVPVTLGK